MKNKESGVLEVYDGSDALVFEQELLDGQERLGSVGELFVLELEDLEMGTYMVVLKLEGEKVGVERLVVVR